MPIRSIALLLAALTAIAVGLTAIGLSERDAGVVPASAPATSHAGRFSGPTTGHPALRNGLGQVSGMPVQRLYPEGFGGTIRDERVASMPVQRLYPDGFGVTIDDEPTVIMDGRRRKW
jgi:hypothetical protein